MNRIELLKLLLKFSESRNRIWFTKEEFFVWLWRKGYRCSFETVARHMRRFVHEGFLIRRYRQSKEWPVAKTVEYHVNRYAVRMYLRKNGFSI